MQRSTSASLEQETVAAVLRAFKLHRDNIVVLRAASGALATLTQRDPSSGQAFTAQGGLEYLRIAMSTHSAEASLQAAGCRALGALIRYHAAGAAYFAYVDLVYVAMDGHPSCAEVQAAAYDALHAHLADIEFDPAVMSMAKMVWPRVEATAAAYASDSAVSAAATTLRQSLIEAVDRARKAEEEELGALTAAADQEEAARKAEAVRAMSSAALCVLVTRASLFLQEASATLAARKKAEEMAAASAVCTTPKFVALESCT